jgi:DNA polymerase-1
MIKTKSQVRGSSVFVLEPEDEFPALPEKIHEIFLDVETTPAEEGREAFFPHLGDRICGIALTWDDHADAYYFPIRHKNPTQNLDLESVIRFIRSALQRSKRWVNHNVKFDAHFLRYDEIDVVDLPGLDLVCTLVRAKMFDTDRGTHSLKPLCRSWCGLEMAEELELKTFLRSAKSKDYAVVPADMLGRYAGMDVLGNRILSRFLDRKLEEQAQIAGNTPYRELLDQERKLTRVLYRIEREGMLCSRKKVMLELARTLQRLMESHENLRELTGVEFVDSNKVMYDVLVTRLGLPIVSWNSSENEEGQKVQTSACFDKEALSLYAIHRDVIVDERKKQIVDSIIDYRTEDTFRGLFLETYLDLSTPEGRLHANFNQLVRTGRMSCSTPNGQQLNLRAKALIHPGKDRAFLSADASQVEFRLIIDYIKDESAIEAYRRDPRTDFHQWVADLAGIKRKPGKILNFSVAFGAGEKKVQAELAADASIMNACPPEIREDNEAFLEYCYKEARRIYRTYHEKLPGIKRWAKQAQAFARQHGYVYSKFGRVRHLSRNDSRKAMNTIVQGSASDYVKSRMVALDSSESSFLSDNGVVMILQVHDQILFEGPIDVLSDLSFAEDLSKILEFCPVETSVPFKWDMGWSAESWAHADSDGQRLAIV